MEIVVVTSDDDYNDDDNNNNVDDDCGNDNNISNNNNSNSEGCPSSSLVSSPSPIRLKMHIAAATTTNNNNNYKAQICALLYLFLHILLIGCLLGVQIFGIYVLFVEGLSTDSSIVILLLTHVVLLPLIPLGLAFIVAPLKSRRAELVAVRIVLFLFWALFAASLTVMFWLSSDDEEEQYDFDLKLSQFLFGAIDFASGILFTVGWAYGDYYS